MALIISGIALLALELARLAHVVGDNDLNLGSRVFALAAPLLVLTGLWRQKRERRAAVPPAAVGVFVLLNRDWVGSGLWTTLVVCACGALVIGLGVKARNPEDDRKDARMLLVFLEVAALGLLALYLLPMLGLGG